MNNRCSEEHLNPGRSFILLSLPNGKRDKFERDIAEKGWKAVFYKVNGRIDFENNDNNRSPVSHQSATVTIKDNNQK